MWGMLPPIGILHLISSHMFYLYFLTRDLRCPGQYLVKEMDINPNITIQVT